MLRINDVALRANGKFQAQKSLIFKDFFWFLGEILRNYYVTTPCEPSGLEPATFYNELNRANVLLFFDFSVKKR